MVVAVVEDHTFSIDKYVENTVDYAKVGEHYYSDKAPGVSFLSIPTYMGLKLFLDLPFLDNLMLKLAENEAFQATLKSDGTGILKQKVRFAVTQVLLTFLTSSLPTALIGVLLYAWLEKLCGSSVIRILVALTYGLLTPVFAYGGAFYGHQLSAALIFGTFAWVTSKEYFSASKLLVVGFLLGYSVVTEYPSAFLVCILVSYVFCQLLKAGPWQRIGWVMLSGALVAAGWMAYNNAIFGGPLNLGYEYSELWVQQHQTGFMSLTIPQWEAIWGITFGNFRGLFYLSPMLLLAVPGFVLWWKRGIFRSEWWIAVSCVLVMFIFNASSIMWWGGFAVGPRYLLPMLPFMVLPLVFVFELSKKRIWLMVIMILMASWAFVTTWGLTLAGQSFPPDTIRAPFIEYALPYLQAGDIARNIGTIMGITGLPSLLPLFIAVAFITFGWWQLTPRLKSMNAV